MRRVKLGLVGAGLIMNNRHVPALQALADRFEVVAVYSRSAEHANALAKRFGGTALRQAQRPPDAEPVEAPAVYIDYRRLLEQPDVEAVDIAIPIAMNYEACKAAAVAGKHIICEKPIAANLADAAAATRLGEQHGVVYMVAENFRYSSDMRQARQWVAAGAIGRPILARWEVVRAYDPNNQYVKTAWRQQPAHPGGYLTDAGVHYMDALRAIVGEVESVQAFVSGHQALLGPEDTAVMNFRLAGGVLGHMTMSWATAESVNVLEILGDKGSVRGVNDEMSLLRPGHATECFKDSGSQGFREEFEDFYAAVVDGKAPEMTPREAYLDFAVLVAAMESAKSDQVIDMKKFLA